MRTVIVLTIALALVCSAFAPQKIEAATADSSQMVNVCINWLSYIVYYTGDWAGDTSPSIDTVYDIVANDSILGKSFSIRPSGHVVVPILTDLPAIKSYSEFCGLDVNDSMGYPQLIKDVLLFWVRDLGYGSRVAQQQWPTYGIDTLVFDSLLHASCFDPIWQIGPLLTTGWHQRTPYNDSCPPCYCLGGTEHEPVGCIATAAAQIMKYHNWPLTGVGDTSYYWDGDTYGPCPWVCPADTLSADYTDSYAWNNMLNEYSGGETPDQKAAVAELCYEVGLAYGTDYVLTGSSGALGTSGTAWVFPSHFRYCDIIDQENRGSHTDSTWFDLITDEISAMRPMHYCITSHSIVCDGARSVEGGKQFHMNYGWGENSDTCWFAIDEALPHSPYPAFEYLMRNIKPCNPCSLAGELPDTVGPGVCQVVGKIFVSSGDTTHILPRTTLIFRGPYPLDVYGTLLAVGTEIDSIIFTTTGLDNHHGLHFLDPGSSGSRLSFCRIDNGLLFAEAPDTVYIEAEERVTIAVCVRGGGGMYCNRSSPTITHCTIRNNGAVGGYQYHGNGGGVYCAGFSSPTFDSCTIQENSANNGGGVYCDGYSSPQFTNCHISGDSASYKGGGVCCYYSRPSFKYCTLSDNSAVGLGGGMYCHSCTLTCNSTIIAFSQGTGIYINTWGTGTQVEYCDVFGNTGGSFGGLTNNNTLGQIVTMNSNGDSCDIYRNIFLDPLFLESPTAAIHHLTNASPCIGAADSTNPPPTDFEGDLRPSPAGTRPDIGADENMNGVPAITPSLDSLAISIENGNAVLRWCPVEGATTYEVYGADEPFTEGILLNTMTDTTWTDEQTSSRPWRYFYYIAAVSGGEIISRDSSDGGRQLFGVPTKRPRSAD